MAIDLLRLSYHNATVKNGLIDFTKEVRGPNNDFQGKYSVTHKRLKSLFPPSVWEPISKIGGHLKFKHKVTDTIVEYKNHGTRAGIDPGAVMTILNSVQKTLNILGNDIFKYKSSNWKKKPNYKASLK